MHAYQRKTEKFLISKEKSFIGSATVKKLFCYQFISPQLEGLEIDLFALEFCFFLEFIYFQKYLFFTDLIVMWKYLEYVPQTSLLN